MKHNLFSRFISVLLAVVMLAGLMSMPSLADTVTGTDTAATDNVNITEDDTEVSSAPAALSEEGTEGDKEPADSNESSEPTDDAETTGDVQEPEEGTEDTQEPADTTGDTVGTDDTQEPADTTEGNGDEEIVGDTQNENAGQEPAGSTESTEAAQSDSEPQDSDNEATSSESFDREAFYDKLMNAQTAEELESLTSGLSDEDIASFQQWLDDDKMAALEEKEAQFSSTDAADDSQPAPAVNYDKVAPISAATAAAASATGALKARARTFSLTPDLLADTQDSSDGLILNKTVTPVPDNDKEFQIQLEAYTTGTVTTSDPKQYDIVLVLDMSTSMAENDFRDGYFKITRLEAMKRAANKFIGQVADQDAGHRIALVGFGENAKYLGDKNANNALVDAADNENILKNTINAITDDSDFWGGYKDLEGATEHGRGMEYAEDIFSHTNDPSRGRVVILFTDGEPAPSGTDNWSSRTVKQAVNSAYDLKHTYNAAVYSVSIMPGTDASTLATPADKYLSYISSNYPDAEYTGSNLDDVYNRGDSYYSRGGSTQGQNKILSEITTGTPASLQDGKSFYLTAGDVETLEGIFEQIGDQIETPSISLGSNTVVQDTVTPYFDLPANTTDVKLEVVSYNGTSFNDSNPQPAAGVTVTFDRDNNRVKVTGFDFDKNFITNEAKSDQTFGSKLRITFTVTADDEFWGGNQVPTNVTKDSGVYKDGTTLVENFPEPNKVDVPLKDLSLTAKDLNIYYGNGAPTAADLVNKIDQPDGWRTAYVNDIVYQVQESTIKDTDDGEYTVTATLSPKHTGTVSNKTTEAVTAHVNVFKPTVTWQDTTQDADSNVDPATNNYVSTVWKHDDALSTGVEMFGEAPDLSFTYKQANGSALPDTLNGSLNVKVDQVTLDRGTNITAATSFAWKQNPNSTGCTNTCVDPNDAFQFRIHDTSNEYPVRFYLEGVQNNAGASNYEFEDEWAILDAVYAGGYVALPDANTCVYSNDLVVPNGEHNAADVITGNDAVSAWLNENNANPKNLTVGSIKEVLEDLVKGGRLTEDAQLVSVGDTKYTVKEVLEQPQDFELVYTQVAENTDVIQEYKRGNRFSDAQQQSYHVHLTVKYKPGNMTITKTFSGVESLPDSFALNVKLGDTTVETLGLADAASYDETTKTYTWKLEDLNGGNYTVEETNFDVTDMVLDATFEVTPQDGTTKTTTDGYSAAVPVEMKKTTSVAITNTYTEAKGDLKIGKIVVLNNGAPDSLKDTVFLFRVDGPEDFSTVVSIAWNGEAGDQGSVTLTDLPVGNYTITELPSLGFVCNKQVQTETVVGGTSKTVTFTNTCDGDEWGDKENLPNTFTYNATDSTWHYNNNK